MKVVITRDGKGGASPNKIIVWSAKTELTITQMGTYITDNVDFMWWVSPKESHKLFNSTPRKGSKKLYELRAVPVRSGNKCPKCGHRLALAYANMDIEVVPDQEPYKNGVIEPVIVDGQEQDIIGTHIEASCHVCPSCDWIDYFELERAHG